MTTTPAEPPPTPEPPAIDRQTVDALIAYANAQHVFTHWHVDYTRSLGKQPHPQSLKNVEGWEFVALALTESYAD
ncbi:hypothetical protein [Aeromicrobium sp.]|uniref:hypothetical protein n=1 Tax=Aeromicrobium sp. TaxID=1871063 RepID=UPI002FC82AB1